MLTWQSFPTQFGPGAVVESERGIERIYLPKTDMGTTAFEPSRLLEDFPGAKKGPLDSADIMSRCFKEGAGIASELVTRIAWPGNRPFLSKVWRLCAEIPAGAFTTYGELAARAGRPKASRAVGQAMSTNPWPLVVPCHRVLGSGNRLANYGGGLKMKRWLLEREGVVDLRD